MLHKFIFPIFGVLKANATILIKQTGAGFLLALFVFIHGVKLFHHHQEGNFRFSISSKVAIGPSSSCAICDYHFVKDADGHTFFATSVPLPVAVYPVYISYLLHRITSVGLAASGRGPPAIV